MGFFEVVLDALISLIPPALVGVLFWVMMRSILRADQKERDTYSQIRGRGARKAR
jgi:hypothetical protein